MRSAARKSPSTALVCLAALGALCCNAVLGIENAELDPTFGAGGSTGGTSGTGGTGGTAGTAGGSTTQNLGNVPYLGCVQTRAECTTCLGTCAEFDVQSCLADKICRTALDQYRACLGPSCGQSDEAEGCREELILAYGAEPLVVALVTCIGGTCVEQCKQSPLVSMCQLYCSCMTDNCGSKPIAADPNCVSACESGATSDPTIAHCRKDHCEYVDFPNATAAKHCDHAVGIEMCTAPIAPGQECANPGGVIPGFPCMFNGDCCNSLCEGETCR